MSSTADLTGVIRHLGVSSGDAASDPELLDRYVREHDQAAFATLVRRYGPLVLGVARRQIADRHRAEDVFQATFLALARSAAKLGGRPALANWLYTVALRQARKARGRTARREILELSAPPRSSTEVDPLDAITARDLLQAIDEELARLPDRLRLPVLLCCVQGLSREEAARRLGWPAGTLKGRLERGRRRLATRLAARGLAPSALLLAPLAAVTIPADLLARAVEQSASPWAKTVPVAVADLAATSVPRAILPTVLLAGCVLAAGLAGWAVISLSVLPAEAEKADRPAGAAPVEPTSTTPIAAAAPVPATTPVPNDPLPAGATMRFGTPRYRHPTTIESLAMSADGKIAVANSGGRLDAAVRIYDLVTGRVILTLEPEPGGGHVEAVALSPDSKTLAVKRNFSVYLHDAGTGKEIARIQYPTANPYSTTAVLSFSPDGRRIAVAAATGKAIHLIDIASKEVVQTLPHANIVYAVAFSPDGKQIVGGGYDSEKNVYFARMWDSETGKELHRLPFGNGGIRSIAYSSDGTTIAIGGDRYGGDPLAVKLFDSSTGKERSKIPFPDGSSVKSVAISPDGKTLAASGGSSTRLFDIATGKESLKIDHKTIGLRFSPDGAVLAGAVAATIYRWDTSTGKSLIPGGGESPIGQIEVVTDNKQIITRGQDGDAHLWDTRTGGHQRRVNVSWQRGLALSPDGRVLVWPVADETIKFKDEYQPNAINTGSRLRMLDLTTGKFVERFVGFEGDAYDLFFTADGKTLVTVDHRDGGVRFWNVATGKVAQSFRTSEKGKWYPVWHSHLSPDGKVLAVTYQRTGQRGLFGRFDVKLWDTATGKQLHDLPGHWNYVEVMAFSADSKYIATGGAALSAFAQQRLSLPGDQVFVWEVATGKMVAQLPGGATAGAFAPDGKTLAIAESDGTIALWDTAKWTVRGEFRGPRARVTTLTFGPDGRLFSGSVDATVLAWDPQAAKAPAEPK